MSRFVALAVASVVGCSAKPTTLSISEYLVQCEAIKGKPVQVGGYLDHCGGYDCALYSTKADADAFKAGWKRAASGLTPEERNEKRRALFARPQAYVGIGYDEEFDRKARPFQNSYVMISGVVDRDTCTGQGGTDRSPGIHPIDIHLWRPGVGLSATNG